MMAHREIRLPKAACRKIYDKITTSAKNLVRVGEDFHEFSEPVTHCPWCGREL